MACICPVMTRTGAGAYPFMYCHGGKPSFTKDPGLHQCMAWEKDCPLMNERGLGKAAGCNCLEPEELFRDKVCGTMCRTQCTAYCRLIDRGEF